MDILPWPAMMTELYPVLNAAIWPTAAASVPLPLAPSIPLHNLLSDAASVPADTQRVKLDQAVEAAQQPRTGCARAILV
jgi:hypothetical protein